MLKIGVGPSSSHTLGPWRAAEHFVDDLRSSGRLASVSAVRVELYGSLAKTGRGHGTGIAVMMGLCGHDPETCDVDEVQRLGPSTLASGQLVLGGVRPVPFVRDRDIVFDGTVTLETHPNGMRLLATLDDGERRRNRCRSHSAADSSPTTSSPRPHPSVDRSGAAGRVRAPVPDRVGRAISPGGAPTGVRSPRWSGSNERTLADRRGDRCRPAPDPRRHARLRISRCVDDGNVARGARRGTARPRAASIAARPGRGRRFGRVVRRPATRRVRVRRHRPPRELPRARRQRGERRVRARGHGPDQRCGRRTSRGAVSPPGRSSNRSEPTSTPSRSGSCWSPRRSVRSSRRGRPSPRRWAAVRRRSACRPRWLPRR